MLEQLRDRLQASGPGTIDRLTVIRDELARVGIRNPLHLRRSLGDRLKEKALASLAREIGDAFMATESPERRRQRTISEYNTTFDKLRGETWLTFMNHGFADSGDAALAPLPKLHSADLRWRHQAKLYLLLLSLQQLTSPTDPGSCLVDVGCGRGGGIEVLHRYGGFHRSVGIDLNAHHVHFATTQFTSENLSFAQASALQLPFSGGSVDTVTNVESSHLYVDIDRFLREVHRILKPGGFLLLADTRMPAFGEALLDAQLEGSAFHLLAKHDITRNVIAACRDDKQRLARDIPSSNAEFPRRLAAEKEREYASGWSCYFVYVLRK